MTRQVNLLRTSVVCFTFAAFFLSQSTSGQEAKSAQIAESVQTKDAATGTTATVKAPTKVLAGETASFVLTLSPTPQFKGGSLYVIIGPVGNTFGYNSGVNIESGKAVYEIRIGLPSDVPTGTWEMREAVFMGSERHALALDKKVFFEVLPAAGVVIPTKAEVNINPNQQQLLRTEVSRLDAELQELKLTLARTPTDEQKFLGQALNLSFNKIGETEERFRKLTDSGKLLDASKIFFGDIRKNYLETRNAISGDGTKFPKNVNWHNQTEFSYSAKSLAVFRALEQNVAAYRTAADEGTLYFTLTVASLPDGAEVYLWRRGDQPEKQSDLTKISKELVYATWHIRIHKDGFKDEEIIHNASAETNHTIIRELKK